MRRASSGWCVTKSTVIRRSAWIPATRSSMSSRSAGPSEAKGSSSRSTGRFETGYQVEQRRLARTARPHDGGDLAGGEFGVEAERCLAIAERNIVQRDG